MADTFNPNKKREENQGIGMTQVPGTEAPTGQPGAPQTPSRTVSGTGGGAQAPGQGGGIFSNLRKYVEANKGSNLGQQIVGQTEKKAQQIEPQMGQARADLEQKLGAEQNRLNQGQQLFNQVQQDPTQLNQQQMGQFQQLYQGQAQAPTVNTQQFQPQVQALQDIAKQAGTEQGRYGLLNQFFGRPSYTQGQQRLDQLLLQSAPGQGKALQQGTQNIAQQQAQALQGLIGQQTTAQQQISDLAKQRQTEAQGLIGKEVIGEGQGTGLLGGLVDTLEGRTGEKQAQAKAGYEALQKAFGEGFGTPEEQQKALSAVQALGIDPSKVNVYDIASQKDVPKDFLKQMNVTPEMVASEQEKNRLNALYQLTGQTPGMNLGELSKTPLDLSQMLDRGRLNEITANRQNELASQLKPLETRQSQLAGVGNLQGELEKALQQYSLENKITDPFEMQKNNEARDASINAIKQKYIDQGLDPNVIGSLYGAGGALRDTSTEGMHAGRQSVAQNLAPYLQELANVQSQIPQLQSKYGAGTTLADLLNKYKSIPLQTAPSVGTGIL